MICKVSSEAKSKSLKSHDANKPASYIIHLDDNNSYGHSVKQVLQTETLDWVNPKDFNLDNYSNDSPRGCFLEVDIDYPE